MSVLLDPEENEIQALFNLFDDFTGKSVLEIGCGDGRLTWRYAEHAARVVALDLDVGKLKKTFEHRFGDFSHVNFLNEGLEPFAARNREKFDIAILAWSL